MRELQALSAHATGILYSLVTRSEGPVKNAAIDSAVGINSEVEATVLTRAGTAFRAMLPWTRKAGEESKYNGTEGDRRDEDDEVGDSSIIRAKPSDSGVVPERKQSHCPPVTAKQNRVSPTGDEADHRC